MWQVMSNRLVCSGPTSIAPGNKAILSSTMDHRDRDTLVLLFAGGHTHTCTPCTCRRPPPRVPLPGPSSLSPL